MKEYLKSETVKKKKKVKYIERTFTFPHELKSHLFNKEKTFIIYIGEEIFQVICIEGNCLQFWEEM